MNATWMFKYECYFQYSIGDAIEQAGITELRIPLLSILHWRCGETEDIMLRIRTPKIFQYSIGDATV